MIRRSCQFHNPIVRKKLNIWENIEWAVNLFDVCREIIEYANCMRITSCSGCDEDEVALNQLVCRRWEWFRAKNRDSCNLLLQLGSALLSAAMKVYENIFLQTKMSFLIYLFRNFVFRASRVTRDKATPAFWLSAKHQVLSVRRKLKPQSRLIYRCWPTFIMQKEFRCRVLRSFFLVVSAEIRAELFCNFNRKCNPLKAYHARANTDDCWVRR